MQVQQQSQSQGAPRVVQTVASLANIGTISRVIATTAGPVANMTRVTQPAPTPIGRIPIGDASRMALHSLQLAPTRTTPTPVKTIPTQSIAQTVQIKPTIQQQPGLRITPGNVGSAGGSGASSNNNATPTNTSNNNNNIVSGTAQPVQSLYLNSPQTTTTYYSVESSGEYCGYRVHSKKKFALKFNARVLKVFMHKLVGILNLMDHCDKMSIYNILETNYATLYNLL